MNFEIVFVGETNDGKTTIVSSLVEDENAAISPTPGTTKKAHRHSLKDAEGNLIFAVWDTPGIEETDEIHAWFVKNASKTGNLAKQYIREHEDDSRWKPETELLRPIAGGALVVYVAASNRKPQSTDRKQLEVIRIIGANRIALINQKPGKDHTAAWREVLKREIGIVRAYSPLTAGIRQRLELLDKLADCAESHGESIRAARNGLRQDWQDRLENLARMMLSTVYETSQASAFSRKNRAEAEEKLGGKLKKIESRLRKDARELFNHKNLRIDSKFFRADLNTSETWKLWGLGLSRNKAIKWGIYAGAVVGLAFDVPAGGLTFGIPTLIGAAGGGLLAAAYVYTPFGKGKAVKKGFEAVIELRSQMLSVLLDRMIIYARCMLRVSHGLRSQEAIQAETTMNADSDERLSFVDKWEKDALKAWGIVVGKMKKAPSVGAVEEREPEAFETVIQQIVADLDVE